MLAEPVHEPDFHELVAMVQRYPRLLRLLGLVVSLEFDVTPDHFSPGTQVQVAATWSPNPATHAPVFARTMSEVGAGGFRAVPKPADSDLVDGQLRLGDGTRFGIHTVNADAGAIKALQHADNVIRAHVDLNGAIEKYSAYTPDGHALPTQTADGIAVTRKNRAHRLAHQLAAAAAHNDTAFNPVTGAPLPPPPGVLEPPTPLFHADDLVRGYRWDVRSASDPVWRSLMELEGEYRIGADGDVMTVAAQEEGVAVTGATTAGGAAPPPDLYLHESLMQWAGWSLAARQPGSTVGHNDQVSDPDAPTDAGGNPVAPVAPIKAAMAAKPGSLPRLRFGESYRVRARAVDIAGASELRTDPAPVEAMSPEVRYLRFEPVAAPLAVLHGPADLPGESNVVAVLRSEHGADATPGTTRRHLVPPRTNIVLAEHHGLLDTDQAGQPLDTQALAQLGALDAQDLSTHPAIQPPVPGGPLEARYFPVDDLDLNFLPDPLAQRLLVRDLPVGTGGATERLPPVQGGGVARFLHPGADRQEGRRRRLVGGRHRHSGRRPRQGRRHRRSGELRLRRHNPGTAPGAVAVDRGVQRGQRKRPCRPGPGPRPDRCRQALDGHALPQTAARPRSAHPAARAPPARYHVRQQARTAGGDVRRRAVDRGILPQEHGQARARRPLVDEDRRRPQEGQPDRIA